MTRPARLFLAAPPAPDGRATAFVGEVAWEDAASGAATLADLADEARRAGKQWLVGPVDGSTWARYRVVTESDGSPPFPLEPSQVPACGAGFLAARFTPFATYASTRLADPEGLAAEAQERVASLAPHGITLRPFDPTDGEGELRALFPLMSQGFHGNPFFVPVGEAEFLTRYRPLLGAIDPGLVLIAEREGAPVGLLFAYPGGPNRWIGKTLAVKDGLRGVGLGRALLAEGLARACAKGLTEAIVALTHEDNLSWKWVRGHGTPIRRYALYGLAL